MNFLLFAVLKIGLPIIFIVSIIFRPCALSGIYLLLFCYLPLVPTPTYPSMREHTGRYLVTCIVISLLTFCAQVGFQIFLFATPPYGHVLEKCEWLETLLRQIGFIRLDSVSIPTAITWLSPEVVMLFGTLAIYFAISRIVKDYYSTMEQGIRLTIAEKPDTSIATMEYVAFIGKFITLVLLFVAAILRPSLLGGLYFLVFLACCTWWACNKSLQKGFAYLLRCVMVIAVAHMIVLFAYQLPISQEYLSPNSTIARVVGITQLMYNDCSEDVRDFKWVTAEWDTYLNPLILMFLYCALGIESRILLSPKIRKKQGAFSRLDGSFKGSQRLSRGFTMSATTRKKWQSATRKVRVSDESGSINEITPLMRGVNRTSRRYGSDKKVIIQDSSGSVTVPSSENAHDIALSELESRENDEDDQRSAKGKLFDDIMYAFLTLADVIYNSSYVVTNITMMAWSITYHSWITFVFLLWANVLWMVPNQRRAMLRTSPFIVAYAWFLLISGYIYSMNLTDSELPTVIDKVKLAQIGFEKILYLPCKALTIKCLYTLMFWITLKQYMKEKQEAKKSSALADMVAPLQVTVQTAAGVQKEEEKGSLIMKKIGQYLKIFFTYCWIWIVAATLFSVAITGDRITSFRIIYMALFLVFVITFQLSFRLWKRMMFGFWLIVIVYSMAILILIYTYQFDNIPDYWTNVLHVSPTLQLDIGLEMFETKKLFMRLVTPTFFVIITVIQLQYFHKDFLEISTPKGMSMATSENTSVPPSNLDTRSDRTDASSEKISALQSEEFTPRKDKWAWFAKKWFKIINTLFVICEIHFSKLLFVLAALMCIYDKCALYVIIVLLITIGFSFGRFFYLVALYAISVLCAALLLCRMMYQIEYINHNNWNVTCPINVTETNSTYCPIPSPVSNESDFNNAEWLGFEKIAKGSSLMYLIRWNLIIIVAMTLYTVVLIRQQNHRIRRGVPVKRAYFIYPKVKRVDADLNLKLCLKYLANFAFYKFGIEMCFIMTVILIGQRMDIYALYHAIWLTILIALSRTVLSKAWFFYLFFTAITIPIQYCILVGLPPQMCFDLPWEIVPILQRLRLWAFVADLHHPISQNYIILDFILMLLLARQYVVFRIESKYHNREYQGGSNDVIIHLHEDPEFTNPVPDFITYCHSYLDIVKRFVLQGFFWITLACLFVTGTNTISIFAVGYLLGSFVFLWLGSDLFLRPLDKIISSWNVLLYYNVFVILLKATLQLITCLYGTELRSGACWLVQLFALTCVRSSCKVPANPIDDSDQCDIPMYYATMTWDTLCFAFLILQKRNFHSFNFFHTINDAKATTILASRGAELIEELHQMKRTERDEYESQVLNKIKQKMDKIKANQKKLIGPQYKDTRNHYVDQPPLAKSTSMSSCSSGTHPTSPAGYHTPIDDEEPPPPISATHTQVPSPFSALMTGSLDAYLEPQRISFSSPPNSELNPRPQSPDDSFPVFSPPPYEDAPPYTDTGSDTRTTVVHRQSSLGPPWMQGRLVTPQQSIMSYSSRSPLSHRTYKIHPGSRPTHPGNTPTSHVQAVRSGDYYMFDDMDEDDDHDLDILMEPKSTITDVVDAEDDQYSGKKGRRATFTQFVNATFNQERRASMPLSRQPSKVSARSQLSAPLSAPPTITEQEPKPSTSSKYDDDDDDDEEDDGELEGDNTIATEKTAPPPDMSWLEKIVDNLKILVAFFVSLLVSFTLYLNEFSKDYRYVLKLLDKEKKMLKEQTQYSKGLRLGKNRVWQPSELYTEFLSKTSIGQHSHSQYDKQMSFINQPILFRLALALWYIMLSHSAVVCYMMIFLNQIKSATFLTLPLPLMVFFWGSLSIPRASKTFWVTIIAYTEIIVLLKCIFQFEILFWNQTYSLSPFYPPRIIGVEKREGYAFWDLLLLLVVFFHRYLLKCRGLWNTVYTPAVILADGDYRIVNNELEPVNIDSEVRARAHAVPISLINRHALHPSYYIFSPKSESNFPFFIPAYLETVLRYESPIHGDEHSGAIQTASVVPSKNDDETETMDDEVVLSVRTEEARNCDTFQTTARMAFMQYGDLIKAFFYQLLDPNSSRLTTNVYSIMFLCDFFNFFVILIGYNSFGPYISDSAGVSSYLEDNKVPVLFLLMLILQFAIIIVDRALFLRKYILGKVIFQVIQVIFLHLWLFVLYPLITDRSFNTVLAPQMYYIVKCVYLLLSAYQIRCGYPTRILGNFICKAYGMVNIVLFKVFMAIPFLFELRTVMDWMWTDTSMSLMEWLKMEDIFVQIFQIKCARYLEEQYPAERGTKKRAVMKYLQGGTALLLMIIIIWFPLVFFSLGSAVGKSNVPYEVTVNLRIGPFQPIYTMSVQSNSMNVFNENDYQRLLKVYEKDSNALTFISNYEADDVAAVKLSFDSATMWNISPPDRERMKKLINSTQPITVRFQYVVSHKSNTKEDSPTLKNDVILLLPPTDPVRKTLMDVMDDPIDQRSIIFPHLLPKFIKVTNRGTIDPISQLMEPTETDKDTSLRSLSVKRFVQNQSEWWKVEEYTDDKDINYKKYLVGIPYDLSSKYIIIYTFNDKLFPSTLNFITAGGIIGVYTTMVLVLGRFLRGFFSEVCFKIMFDDVPYVDRVLQLCFDVYLVREVGEFCLEEDLFAKLVFLFRSPETLIKWTRPKEEVADADDPEADADDVD